MEFKLVENDSEILITSVLAKEVFEEFYTAIIGQAQVEYMVNKFQSRGAILNQIKNNLIYYNIFLENSPIGYIAIKINEPKEKLFLSKLYLLDKYRKKGLSKYIFNFIEKIAKDNKLSSIWLHVNKNNPSIEIYKKYGYVITDSVKDDIGNGFFMDDYIMELKINE